MQRRQFKTGLRWSLAIAGLLFLLQGKTQSLPAVEAELTTLHRTLASTPCGKAAGRLISNRAMNAVLSDKVGSYLSQFTDLSFYKNNITFDAAGGTFSLNHNLFQPSGKDEAIRSFLVVGGRANIANAFASAFSNRAFQNEMGVTVKQTWLSSPKQYFDCSQKREMDAERAVILFSLFADLNKQAAAFEQQLARISSADVPGRNMDSVKAHLRKKFFTEAREEYNNRFALLQAQALIKRNGYRKLVVGWTSLSLYLPVVRQQFFVAPSLNAAIKRKLAYPVELALHHTRLIDLGKKGRFFFILSGTIFQNNTVQSQASMPVSSSDYLRLGGTDTLRLADLGRNNLYNGDYRNFFTPAIKAQVVYFPSISHIGISAQLEQNFGQHNSLSAVLGLPIVLIDREANPSANFQFQLRYADIGNKVAPSKPLKDKLSVGLTVGVPFSKIIY